MKARPALNKKRPQGKTTSRSRKELNSVAAVPAAQDSPAVTRSAADLSAANQQMEAFVYTIAHDLRAPLRAMRGFATMLLEEVDGSLNDRARDYANRIMVSAKYMDTLLMDLLSFSQISQQELEFRAVNLKRVVDSTLEQLQKDIEEKHAHIEAIGPWPSMRAHEKTVQHVMQNLVSNALKFVKAGEEPRVRISTTENGNMVRVLVEDKGIGIDPEYISAVWEIFKRVHGEDYQGTGVGLAIVAKGVERMGGRVGVESTPGQGSQFWFELPKA